jgi:hypothetical protein
MICGCKMCEKTFKLKKNKEAVKATPSRMYSDYRISGLGIHLSRTHGMSTRDYFRKFYCDYDNIPCGFCGSESVPKLRITMKENDFEIDVDWKDGYICNNANCSSERKELNANSIKFVMIAFGLPEKEALAKIHERNESPFYRCNHENDESYSKSQRRNKEWFMNEYGSQWEDKWDAYLKRQAETATKSYILDNFGQSTLDARLITKAKYIEKYGIEEAEVRWDSYITKQRRTSLQKEFSSYVKKYGELEGSRKFSLDCFGKEMKMREIKDKLMSLSYMREHYSGDFRNKEFRNKIKESQNGRCGKCGIDESLLDINMALHHINYDKQDNSRDNLIFLCSVCHGKSHGTIANRKLHKNEITKLNERFLNG